MRVEYDVYNGILYTPCPRGRESKVRSYNCTQCPHYAGYLGQLAIECLPVPHHQTIKHHRP